MVDSRTVLRNIAKLTAIAAAGAVGGPIAAAEFAALLATPVGTRIVDRAIEDSARNVDVALEDLAMGGLVTRPTLGLTGEMGPEMVIPLTKMKRKRSRSARASDKRLSVAFKEANRRYRKKDGSLRSGRTQADIARLAHKLRKKGTTKGEVRKTARRAFEGRRR